MRTILYLLGILISIALNPGIKDSGIAILLIFVFLALVIRMDTLSDKSRRS